MRVTYSLIFNRKKTLRKDGTATIQIRAYLNGQNKYFTTGIQIRPEQWDDKRSKIIRHPNQFLLNKQISIQIQEMEAFEFQMSNKQKGKFYLQQLENYKAANLYKSFTKFFEVEMEQEDVKDSTKETYQITLRHLKKYRNPIFFENLDYELVRKFDAFLKSKGCSINTRAKHHKNLKKFINLAIKMDLIDINNNPYKLFKVRKERTTRDFLSPSEILKFELLEFNEFEAHLSMIRDLFLFCCYTGLRYSDVSKLAKKNLIKTTEGYKLDMISQKSQKRILLPLYRLFKTNQEKYSKPERIVRKYIKIHNIEYDEDPYYDDIPLFKNLTEQHINRELKALAKRAGIHKNITTHVGRHTFGTTLALKVKPAILQKLMQHSKLKETMIYVHLSNQSIENELNKVNWD